MTLRGPDTRFPLGAVVRSQKCVSHSTTESEIVSGDNAMRTEGLPALDLWDTVLERQCVLKYMEDNEAMIKGHEDRAQPNYAPCCTDSQSEHTMAARGFQRTLSRVAVH